MAAAPGFSAASWAAVEVLVTSIVLAAGQVLGQPVAALADRLRPAVDLLHLRPRTLRQQRMMDVHLDLAADPHRQPGEHVQRVGDAAVGRVLDRHQAEIGVSLVDLLEHGGNGPHRHELARSCQNGAWRPGGCSCKAVPGRRSAAGAPARGNRSGSRGRSRGRSVAAAARRRSRRACRGVRLPHRASARSPPRWPTGRRPRRPGWPVAGSARASRRRSGRAWRPAALGSVSASSAWWILPWFGRLSLRERVSVTA